MRACCLRRLHEDLSNTLIKEGTDVYFHLNRNQETNKEEDSSKNLEIKIVTQLMKNLCDYISGNIINQESYVSETDFYEIMTDWNKLLKDMLEANFKRFTENNDIKNDNIKKEILEVQDCIRELQLHMFRAVYSHMEGNPNETGVVLTILEHFDNPKEFIRGFAETWRILRLCGIDHKEYFDFKETVQDNLGAVLGPILGQQHVLRMCFF